MLVELITKKPPASKLGARLASTGLAILIACNSLIAQPGMERVATNWIRWLVNWGQVKPPTLKAQITNKQIMKK